MPVDQNGKSVLSYDVTGDSSGLSRILNRNFTARDKNKTKGDFFLRKICCQRKQIYLAFAR